VEREQQGALLGQSMAIYISINNQVVGEMLICTW
jgi:hypothetical protein